MLECTHTGTSFIGTNARARKKGNEWPTATKEQWAALSKRQVAAEEGTRGEKQSMSKSNNAKVQGQNSVQVNMNVNECVHGSRPL